MIVLDFYIYNLKYKLQYEIVRKGNAFHLANIKISNPDLFQFLNKHEILIRLILKKMIDEIT